MSTFAAKRPKLPCYIDSLPDLLLAKIFAYLPHKDRLRVSEVCSRWNAVTRLDWLDVIDLDLTPIPSPNIDAILRLCPNVESIFGLRRFLIMDDLTEHYQTNATSIKLYDLMIGVASTTGGEWCTIAYRHLLYLVGDEDRLERLKWGFLRDCCICNIFHKNLPDELNAADVSTASLNRWFDKLPQLEQLVLHKLIIADLWHHKHLALAISIIPFSVRAGQLTALTRLQLSGSARRSFFCPYLLSTSLRQLQQLECLILHLKLSVISHHADEEAEREFCDAVASLKNLQELSLRVELRHTYDRRMVSIRGDRIADVLLALPKLEVLFLFYQKFTREPLVNLFTAHPTLRTLMLVGGTYFHGVKLLMPVRKFHVSASPDPLPFLNVFLGAYAPYAHVDLRFPESAAARIFIIDVPMREFFEKAEVADVLSGVWIAEMILETALSDEDFLN